MKLKKTNIINLILGLIVLSIVLNFGMLFILRTSFRRLTEKNHNISEIQTQLYQFLDRVNAFKEKTKTDLENLLDPESVFVTDKAYDKIPLEIIAEMIGRDYSPQLTQRLKKLVHDFEELEILWKDSVVWRDNYSLTAEDITEQKTLNNVRELIDEMQVSIVSLDGRNRLEQAVFLKKYMSSREDQASWIDEEFVKNLSDHSRVKVADVKNELMDLVLSVEKLAAEDNPDNLADLKDNQMKQNIDRLERTVHVLEGQNVDVGKVSKDSLEQLNILLFGTGHFISRAHQTIVIGDGGLYALYETYLDLLDKGKSLQDFICNQFNVIEKNALNIGSSVQEFTGDLKKRQEDLIRSTWMNILIIAIVFLLVFLIGSWRITVFIQGQLLKQKEACEEINTVLEGAGEAIRVIDGDFNVLKVNLEMEVLMGMTGEEMIGKKCCDLFQGKNCETTDCASQRIMRGEKRVQFEILKKIEGRGQVPFEITATPLMVNGKIIGTIETCRDITRWKSVENQLRMADKELSDNKRSLSNMSVDLQEKDQKLGKMQKELNRSEKLGGMGQLAARVVYEINNPTGLVKNNLETLKNHITGLLAAISSLRELIESNMPQDQEKAKTLQKSLEPIFNDTGLLKKNSHLAINESMKEIYRMQDIIASLGDFVSPEGGEIVDTDINETLEKALVSVWSKAGREIQLIKEFQKLPVIQADPNQLYQAFANLIINAFEAVNDNGIIALKTYFKNSYIYIEIYDNGKGIREEEVGKIFELFYSTKEAGKGSGLGLSVVHKIIEGYKGAIDVKSEEGKGTTFIIKLPVNKRETTAG